MLVKCPSCKKKTEWGDNPFRPFCSERCRLIDLGKWASGEYIIEGKSEDDEEDPGNERDKGGSL
jgi:endogenous inhibitor of DNA gyrase (YacG/DUF329 family)